MFNHNELEIHRTSLKMLKIWKDCMSFSGAQLLLIKSFSQVLRISLSSFYAMFIFSMLSLAE